MQKKWIVLALVAAIVIVVVTTLVPTRGTSGDEEGATAASSAAASAGVLAGDPQGKPGCAANAPAADLSFTLKDMYGKSLKLADLKGKVVVLNFWATWCPPCKEEIPEFVELQDRYGKQGLQFVGISVDDPIEKLAPFAREYRMNYPVVVGLDRDDLQQAYGPLYGIPATFFINREGKICAKHMGMAQKEQFEREIKSLL